MDYPCYDSKRAAQLILFAIQDNREKCRTLDDLVYGLETILDRLPKSELRGELGKHWEVLEQVNAIMLDEGRREMTEEEREDTDSSLRSLTDYCQGLLQG
jgi:hypothetical protein